MTGEIEPGLSVRYMGTNDHSIAWGIAKAVAEQGAELAFTYQGEAFGKRMEAMAGEMQAAFTAAAGDLARCGEDTAVVIPLLFTQGYHQRVDVPRVIAAAEEAAGRRVVGEGARED